ncbi:MAG: type II toxin-antitoxin system YafQ family toxin [Bacteroides sp.]|nr:type II toxin-antitoxin system YafQ family toxin [Bacteroides sp.]MCM1379082.1 type II toxin-antitoxin system YafQ family toxin [Bacteroides sp.]MCM1445780.1 type II toxin-antitoxin system YafQ family toxin [Prevotella sp.]
MKEIKASKSFKKDLKRFANQSKKLRKLFDFIDLLRKEEELPPSYHAHMLIGEYCRYMECHIEGDFLLIWVDETSNLIKLVRVGSHSELFG